MKFYDCSTAPSPRRVRIFIAEKNIDVETIEVNLMKGEHLTPEYKAKNPNLEVPLLELENGTTIAQANAICRYLEDIKPENPLHGRNSIESALVDGANTKIMLDGFMAAAEAFRNSTPGMKNRAMPGPHNYSQIPELAQRGLLRLGNFLSDLEIHFESNEYMVNDYFSVADISALVCIDFAKWVKKPIPEDYENLNRWYKTVSTRPSCKL